MYSIYDMDSMLNEPYPFEAQYHQAQQVQADPVLEKTPPPVVYNEVEPMPRKEGLGGVLSEIRLGALWHDQGPFSHQKEGGVDTNLEVLFVSPDILNMIGSPRPHIGGSINSAGDTSQAYLGLTWEWEFLESHVGAWFAGFSLGGSYHDGHLDDDDPNYKQLGCHTLFRESITGGYRFNGHHGVMLHFDHISNAKLCSTNEGLESLGVRYGYKF